MSDTNSQDHDSRVIKFLDFHISWPLVMALVLLAAAITCGPFLVFVILNMIYGT